MSKFYIVTNERDKAEELYKKAISINGNSALAHTEYGKFLAQGSRSAEAEAELTKAVEVGPTDRNARAVLAGFYFVNKQMDKAEAAYKALAALDADKPQSQAVLADFYSSVGRLDEAIKIYQDILRQAPDFVPARYRLTEILLQRGDTQGASAQIAEALKKDAHDRTALLLRAQTRARTGQPEDLKAAIVDLSEVLKQEPNSRLGLYFMAQANLGLGLTEQAQAFNTDLEKNYPDYLPAKLIHLQLSLTAGDAKGVLSLATDLLTRLSKTGPDRENSPQLLADLAEKAYLARGAAQVQM
jgi:tetratricopeptide (TPR) repeat protein